jgi:hypothetical protein
MPLGTFLDTLPVGLFVAIHSILLLVGVWAIWKATSSRVPYAAAFWLYPLVHVGFLASFGGVLTLKMAVGIEQVLIVVMIVWIVTKARAHSQL